MFVVLTYTSDFIVYFVRALCDSLSKIKVGVLRLVVFSNLKLKGLSYWANEDLLVKRNIFVLTVSSYNIDFY